MNFTQYVNKSGGEAGGAVFVSTETDRGSWAREVVWSVVVLSGGEETGVRIQETGLLIDFFLVRIWVGAWWIEDIF